MRVSGGTLRNVRFTVAADACRHKLRGAVRGSNGEPLAGIEIEAVLDDDRDVLYAARAWSGTGGAFALSVPRDGGYRINITLAGSCDIYFAEGGATTDFDAAAIVRIAGGDIRVSDIWIPEDICKNTISGRLLNASGEPMEELHMRLYPTEGNDSVWLNTADDGAFRFTVPQNGGYRIEITLAENCRVHAADDGVTADREAATTVRVAGQDVRSNITVPDGWCEHAISGRLLDASGGPMTDVQLAAVAEDPWSWQWTRTDSTGAFSVTVPQDGNYRIRITLAEGCAVYSASDGVTTDRDRAATMRVAGRNVRGDITVPDGWCEHAINGRLLDASGEPMADVQLAVFAEDPWIWHWGRTDSTGAFSVTVPQDGSYRIQITLAEGCAVYFASDGVTTDRDMAATVRVAGRDVRGDITVPDGWCEHAISGRLLDASGEPTADAKMDAIPSDGTGGAWTRTGTDGHSRSRFRRTAAITSVSRWLTAALCTSPAAG